MHTSKQLTEQESLALITSMIEKAKGNIGDRATSFLLWGWLVLVTCIAQFVLIQIEFDMHWVLWPVITPLGGIATAIIAYRENKHNKDRGHITRSIRFVWIGIGVTIFFVLLNGHQMGWVNCYAVLISLYGLGTFITGGYIRFRPFIIGGILSWIISAFAYYLPFEYVVLAIGLSMICSYIIPAYLLKRAHAQKA